MLREHTQTEEVEYREPHEHMGFVSRSIVFSIFIRGKTSEAPAR